MARLIRENNILPAQVEKIDVGGNHSMTTTLLHHHPTTGLQGKFSMEFCVAILTLERKAGLAQFQDAVVGRPDVQEMIKRVNFYVDPEAEAAGFDKMTSIIKIHLKGGKAINGRAEFAKWPAQKAEGMIAAVKTLENMGDVSRLAALLTA